MVTACPPQEGAPSIMCLRHVVLLPRAADVCLPSVYPEQRRVTPLESTLVEVFILNTLNPFRMNTCRAKPHFAQFWCNISPFRINTCKSVSKQTTLSTFRINTYEKTGGWGRGIPSNRPIPSPPILRRLFQVPYPVSPLLATLTKTPGVSGYSSHSGTHPPSRGVLGMFQPSIVQRANALLSIPILFTLLRTLLHAPKTQLFYFHAIAHSLQKTTRGGVPLPLLPLIGRSLRTRRSRSCRDGPGRISSRSTFNFRLSTSSVRLLHGPRVTEHGSRGVLRGESASC